MLDFLIFAAVVIVCLIVAIIYLYPGSKKLTTVPGPEPVDNLEGNIPDIVACGSLYEFLCKIHEQYGPVASFWLGPTLCISIGSAKLFKEQANVFDQACILYEALECVTTCEAVHMTSGAECRQRRAAYSACFTPAAMSNYYSVFNQEADKVIATWSAYPADEFVPLMKHMFEYSIRCMLRTLYGVSADNDELVRTVHASYDVCLGEIERQLLYDANEPTTDHHKRFMQHKEKLHAVVQQLMSSHRDVSATSPVQHSCPLIDAAQSLDLSDGVRSADLVSVLIGALSTTAPLLTWAVYCLAVNDDIQDLARQEVNQLCATAQDMTAADVEHMTYLRQIVNETLRWAVISPYSGRVQDIDTVIDGHTIPASTPVIHALGVALHDDDVFPEPNMFDPERFSPDRLHQLPLYAFEPFGFAGKRQCLGREFAMAAVSVMLAKLLHSNLELTLAPDQTVTAKYDLTGKPEDEIWMAVDKPH